MGCYRAHRILNQHGRYLDATVPPGTRVWALFKDDDVVYSGKVLDYHEINWYKVRSPESSMKTTTRRVICGLSGRMKMAIGIFIPKSHCVIVSSSTSKPTLAELRHQANQDQPIFSAQQAILAHMSSMGKTLVLQPPQDVMCLWDGVWYPALTCETMPLGEVLRRHLHFENCSGNYYCVCGPKKMICALMPERLIKWTNGR
jgi:hypothetical protein